MKTLILGIGNPVRCDDGVGIRVAQEVSKRVGDPQITVAEACHGGLFILDAVLGYDRVLLIDSIQTKGGTPGEVYRLRPSDLSFARHLSSPHQVNFITALELGKALDLPMPERIDIIAVEAGEVTSFRERCTREVEQAIPVAVEMVLSEFQASGKDEG